MSGRYMRRSAPTSVAIGTMLDVGARVMKNQAPRNPHFGRRARYTAEIATSRGDDQKVRQRVAKTDR